MTSGIHINFSDEEKESEGRLYEAIPTGEYRARIIKIEDKKVKDEGPDGEPNKNAGKPWWNIQCQICDGGKYNKRVVFVSAMLFQGAGYTLVQLLKSTGHGAAVQTGKVPPKNEFIGKEVILCVQRKRDSYAAKQNPGVVEYTNNVTGIKPVSGTGAGTAKSGNKSLLPGS